jgi:hypothetical protein
MSSATCPSSTSLAVTTRVIATTHRSTPTVAMMGWPASYTPPEPANSLVRGGASLVGQPYFVT